MRYPIYIAKRYLFSKSNRNAVNIISGIAIVAVIVGSMALFIVLSGFSGLKHFALQFTNVFDSDLKVNPAKGKTLSISPEQFVQLQQLEGVDAVSKIIEERIFLQYQGKNHIAFIKGVDSQYEKVIPTDSILFSGDWMIPNQDEVVVGFSIVNKLSLPIRDYGNLLEVYVPKPGTGQINILDPSSAFTKRKVVASGIYEINDELNGKYVFSDLEFARQLLGLDSLQVSSLEFKLNPGAVEETIVPQLTAMFPEEVVIKNRIQQNDALYKMLNAENLFTYLFVSLIAAIAIFNLAGTIIMVILEKRGNIRTLFFLGLTIGEIRKIFFYNGLMMTLLGVAIGLFLGSAAVLLQLKFGLVPITPTLPYPVKYNLLNLLLVLVTISALGALASKIASLKVTEKLLD
ncbi:ABC transporter permease [Aureisphaera galaxeae]|uniref:ABC transporter permease n=1 Tax=Aureisphaera galaxeae TaxID=1538023 RepID=UPI00234FCB8B|nr:FtsX-like permease family protein [Aureisphaera galaxeae]MDC8005125.1 ABC transporter permease [Aureisphaera galaxeae]